MTEAKPINLMEAQRKVKTERSKKALRNLLFLIAPFPNIDNKEKELLINKYKKALKQYQDAKEIVNKFKQVKKEAEKELILGIGYQKTAINDTKINIILIQYDTPNKKGTEFIKKNAKDPDKLLTKVSYPKIYIK